MTDQMDFEHFLSGTPAEDYIFQEASYEELMERASNFIQRADAVLIGAGAGMSEAAGLSYGGKRFTDNFGEFIKRYGSRYMTDMYSAGFYPFPTEEERWGYWSKHSWLNRIEPGGLPLYKKLFDIVREKDYFVLTTNVDHQFQKSGFDEDRIFATQGDYGLIQCMRGCHKKTYDAVSLFSQMNEVRRECRIPSHMVPRCPVCGGRMAMNLRCDSSFVEDESWQKADGRFGRFLTEHVKGNLLLLELGVGFNTPTIIRFPFEKLLKNYPQLTMVRLNLKEAVIPQSLSERAVGINADMRKTIYELGEKNEK